MVCSRSNARTENNSSLKAAPSLKALTARQEHKVRSSSCSRYRETPCCPFCCKFLGSGSLHPLIHVFSFSCMAENPMAQLCPTVLLPS